MLFTLPAPPGNPPEPEGRRLPHALSAAWNFEFPLPGAPAPELLWGIDGGVPLLPEGGVPPPNPPDGRVTPCCFKQEVNALWEAFVDDELELELPDDGDVDVDEPEPDALEMDPHAASVSARTPTASAASKP